MFAHAKRNLLITISESLVVAFVNLREHLVEQIFPKSFFLLTGVNPWYMSMQQLSFLQQRIKSELVEERRQVLRLAGRA